MDNNNDMQKTVNESKREDAAASSQNSVNILNSNIEEKSAELHQPASSISTLDSGASLESDKILLFNKYSYDVTVNDLSLKNYINLSRLPYPITFRKHSQYPFSKSNINIVERLENSLMRGGTGSKIGGHIIRTEGRLQGKKLKTMKIVEEAFDIINKKTKQNPLQVYINAIENSAPIEDTTRVRYGGIISNVAVDISANRRLDIALRNIAIAVITSAFKNKKSIVEALAEELVMAANNDPNSYSIKRKNEIERMARSAK
ncbi:MAG: 30S ribosomal protein S7 [Candidatus Micrarchaeia archaeon]